jgi:hypothetical protein
MLFLDDGAKRNASRHHTDVYAFLTGENKSQSFIQSLSNLMQSEEGTKNVEVSVIYNGTKNKILICNLTKNGFDLSYMTLRSWTEYRRYSVVEANINIFIRDYKPHYLTELESFLH